MAEPPYSSETSNPPFNEDPLIVDQGFPLDVHSQNLVRDFIAPVVVPHWFAYGPNSGVVNEVSYFPTSPGVVKSDGPTPAAKYPGVPGYAARVSIEHNLYTEYDTGLVFTSFDWRLYQYFVTYNRLLLLSQNRDVTSDILNLWGKKPHFVDNWFSLIRPTRPINPRCDY